MPIPQRKTIPTTVPGLSIQITDDGSRTLVMNDSGDGYHSGCGALAETRHVYLRNSGVADRLAHGMPTSVLEIGLGTGMGMLVTLDAAMASHTPLRYEAWESNWLPADVLGDLNLQSCVDDDSLVDRLITFRQSLGSSVSEGTYTWEPADEGMPSCRVDIRVGDVTTCDFTKSKKVDAIYFDPFAPEHNPDLWTPAFLSKMCRQLTPEGTLVTYCCSRVVRDAMKSVGLNVTRVPGPTNGKREVLVARRGNP